MKLNRYLAESQRRQEFMSTGDTLGVAVNEELIIEMPVVYHNKNSAMIELDETAFDLLEACGCAFEEDVDINTGKPQPKTFMGFNVKSLQDKIEGKKSQIALAKRNAPKSGLTVADVPKLEKELADLMQMDEAKSKTNFDVEDLYRLQNINDLEKLKKQAFVLISKPSEKPMKPEKVSWFERSLEKMNSKDSVMKMMWDLFMSGEGLAVQGSRYSTDKNYYRKAFGEELEEAKYQGKEVKLNKPMRGDVKKFKVYVRDPKTGNVKKVNFGSKEMEIKRDDPARRKSFRARHKCADKTAAKDRHTAGYWSCRLWSSKPVSDILKGK